jgi:hypothetical protein
MLACWIFGRPVHWAEGPLPGYAALKLPLYFPRAVLFKRISAAARDQPCDDEQDRRAFHLLILESEGGIARRLKRRRESVEALHCCCRFSSLTLHES